MKLSKAYMAKESREPARSKMTKREAAHEKRETSHHERIEHAGKKIAKQMKHSLRKQI